MESCWPTGTGQPPVVNFAASLWREIGAIVFPGETRYTTLPGMRSAHDPWRDALFDGDGRNFDGNVARQPRRLDGGAGRRVVLEVAAVCRVHLCKIVQIADEHGGRHHVIHRHAVG